MFIFLIFIAWLAIAVLVASVCWMAAYGERENSAALDRASFACPDPDGLVVWEEQSDLAVPDKRPTEPDKRPAEQRPLTAPGAR